jgi:serpin B
MSLSLATLLAAQVSALTAGGICDRPVGPAATGSELQSLATSYSQFSVDLYERIRGEEGNLFFSPYSVATALAMTQAGARGGTAREIDATLALSLTGARLHAANGAMARKLSCREDVSYRLVSANALWGQQGYRFDDSFLRLLDQSYGAGLQAVDFKGEAAAARRTINAWVEEQTNDKIENLIPEGALSSWTRLVLTNAVYFKGSWLFPFPAASTEDAAFWLSSEQAIQVPMMSRTRSFPYVETPEVRAVALPIRARDGSGESDQSFVVLMPKQGETLERLEDSLTGGTFEELLEGMEERQVKLSIPKFRFEAALGLKDPLEGLGMASAFDPASADFGGISATRDEPLFLADVLHKGFINVDEAGVEAAAATGVVMTTHSAPLDPIEFRADRPFLFAIVDRELDVILFMGRLVDPR